MRRLLLLFYSVCLLALFPSHSSAAYPIKYDNAFRQWGQFYFPSDDWKHWKAQGIAESRLNQDARSHCGAIGIMQLMPLTAKDLKVNPFDAESNIQGGIKYDAQLDKYWTSIKSADNRRDFVYASFNAGMGWIRRALKLSDSQEWEDVSQKLPQITGTHSKETITYVKRIRQIYWQIRN